MLFNSYEFIFAFLPAALVGFYLLGRLGRLWAIAWLALSSFAFYAAPQALYGQSGLLPIALLAGSTLFNYAAGLAILRLGEQRGASLLTAAAVAVNLAVLAWFKYSGFLIQNFTAWFGGALPWQVLLPIGISFYTFTQIAFLVDARRGRVEQLGFIEYILFVTWFPHLVAGPILHHAEMIAQFKRPTIVQLQFRNVAIGLSLFSLGLAKKILIADNVAPYASSVFADPQAASMQEAWTGILAYTCQIYFDFSGYSDMAIGLSRLFNVDLPLNFYSPYKSTSIIEFWRRWHISLSRFLRDYLYIPLGGGRAGAARRYLNLMITMVLGGLWHGAAWTFVIWGALHGFYLLVNHAWRRAQSAFGLPAVPRPLAWLLTFLAVVVAWVFFRAPDLTSAGHVLGGLVGLHGLDGTAVLKGDFDEAWLTVLGCLLIALLMPNSQQIFRLPFNPRGSHIKESRPALRRPNRLQRWLLWRPTPVTALVYAAALVVSISLLTRTSEFLYFQF